MTVGSGHLFTLCRHIAAVTEFETVLLPGLKALQWALHMKATEFQDIIKIGRTHTQDATPLTLGQEFSGYAKQIENSIRRVEDTLPALSELALGGTAVGTGLNTTEGYDAEIAKMIADETGKNDPQCCYIAIIAIILFSHFVCCRLIAALRVFRLPFCHRPE